jgi:hypothetical protein
MHCILHRGARLVGFTWLPSLHPSGPCLAPWCLWLPRTVMGSNPILSKVLLSGWRHWGTTGQEGGGGVGPMRGGGWEPSLGPREGVAAAPPELITVPTVGL